MHEAHRGIGRPTACSLGSLAQRAHLISFQLADPVLLGHFLAHYLQAVRVPAAHMHLLLDAESNATLLHACYDVVHRAGLVSSAIRVVAASRDAQHGKGFDHHKLNAINAVLRALPAESLAIVADADEFFSYPCDIEHRVAMARLEVSARLSRSAAGRGYESSQHRKDSYCASAQMVDRLALSGKIELLREAPPSIAEQFPLRCHFRGGVHTSSTKVVLMTARGPDGQPRSMVSPHAINLTRTSRCDTLPPSAPEAHTIPIAK